VFVVVVVVVSVFVVVTVVVAMVALATERPHDERPGASDEVEPSLEQIDQHMRASVQRLKKSTLLNPEVLKEIKEKDQALVKEHLGHNKVQKMCENIKDAMEKKKKQSALLEPSQALPVTLPSQGSLAQHLSTAAKMMQQQQEEVAVADPELDEEAEVVDAERRLASLLFGLACPVIHHVPVIGAVG